MDDIVLDLLEKLSTHAKGNANETDSTPSESTARRRKPTSPTRKEEHTEPEYTQEQLECVKRIKA